jgi:transcriptional regulator
VRRAAKDRVREEFEKSVRRGDLAKVLRTVVRVACDSGHPLQNAAAKLYLAHVHPQPLDVKVEQTTIDVAQVLREIVAARRQKQQLQTSTPSTTAVLVGELVPTTGDRVLLAPPKSEEP